ncbi:MAG: DUF4918 family protein [Flavobacteriales bacterium]|nr:DUF4918 family protein [Flavobacteriales bacterium]MCL4281072.1 DUF4918 family protein [Flavobacteriales bacterium]
MLADRLLREVHAFDITRARLPKHIGVLDPFHGENAAQVRSMVDTFHRRFYADERPRMLMLGINPGRFGAGSTGICFTDTKRCEADLGIPVQGLRTHEPSSDFFYRVVRAAGGPEAFYGQVYVQALCPLGFTKKGPQGTPVNLNYYDDGALQAAVAPLMAAWVGRLIATGMRTDLACCIGTGKNFAFFSKLNEEHGFFRRIIPLEHPRFVMQYRYKRLEEYIGKYLAALEEAAAAPV